MVKVIHMLSKRRERKENEFQTLECHINENRCEDIDDMGGVMEHDLICLGE